MKEIKRVYVAGAYSSDNVLGVLNNIREGIKLSLEVLLAGFSPFVPWFDFHFQLMLKDNQKLTVQDYYDYSMAWLEVSDAILLVPGWQKSKGTKKEMERANELGLHIFYSLEDLLNWRVLQENLKVE